MCSTQSLQIVLVVQADISRALHHSALQPCCTSAVNGRMSMTYIEVLCLTPGHSTSKELSQVEVALKGSESNVLLGVREQGRLC